MLNSSQVQPIKDARLHSGSSMGTCRGWHEHRSVGGLFAPFLCSLSSAALRLCFLPASLREGSAHMALKVCMCINTGLFVHVETCVCYYTCDAVCMLPTHRSIRAGTCHGHAVRNSRTSRGAARMPLRDIFPSWHFQTRLPVIKPISIPQYIRVEFHCINFRSTLSSETIMKNWCWGERLSRKKASLSWNMLHVCSVNSAEPSKETQGFHMTNAFMLESRAFAR